LLKATLLAGRYDQKQVLRAIVNQNRIPEGYTRVYQGKEGGYVQVHATHGKQELANNLHIGQHLANQGERVRAAFAHR
jgi:hypothetical protein